MSNFQRMITIPQEEYLAMTSMQNVKDPMAQHFYSLENQYTTEQKERDPYRRMILQSNTLDEMRQVKDQIRNSLEISTPKLYLNRAKALYRTVEGFLKFNVKGEIYTDGGNIVDNSRVEDLINHAVRDRRRNMIPTGWSEFLTILRDHNVPKSILNRDTLDELDGKAAPKSTIKFQPTTKIEPHTPTKQSGSKVVRFQPSRLKKPTTVDFKSVLTKRGASKRLSFLGDFSK